MILPSAGSLLCFLLVVAFVCLAFVGAVVKSNTYPSPKEKNKALFTGVGGLIVWLIVTAAMSGSGILESAAFPPRIALFFGATNILAVMLAFSSVGKKIALSTPLWCLVGFHCFRFPLELILHSLYKQGVVPIQMTYSGHNFDIITGVFAFVVAGLLYAKKVPSWFAFVFNIVGFALLLAVGFIAFRSVPSPFRAYSEDPALLLPFHPPWVWIVTVCVSGALFGHIVLFRAWRHRSARSFI